MGARGTIFDAGEASFRATRCGVGSGAGEGGSMEELRVPLDGDGFSRRECPRCRAHFKLRWSAREAAVLAGGMARRVNRLVAVDGGELPRRHCPYCAAIAAADDFFTPAVQRHLDAEAERLDAEVRVHRFRLPPEWLGENPRAARGPIASSPPHALEPDHGDDLVRIALPCCNEEHKVSDAWLGPIRCHLCGVAHLRAGPRDIGLELALLKQWTGE